MLAISNRDMLKEMTKDMKLEGDRTNLEVSSLGKPLVTVVKNAAEWFRLRVSMEMGSDIPALCELFSTFRARVWLVTSMAVLMCLWRVRYI